MFFTPNSARIWPSVLVSKATVNVAKLFFDLYLGVIFEI